MEGGNKVARTFVKESDGGGPRRYNEMGKVAEERSKADQALELYEKIV